MYQYDYDGRFPQPAQDKDITDDHAAGQAVWFNALDYYLQMIAKDYERFNEDERNYRTFKQDPVWSDFSEPVRKTNRTIKMNEFLGNVNNRSGVPLVKFYRDIEIDQPTQTVLYVDGRAFDTPSLTTGNTGLVTSYSLTMP